MRFLVEQKAQCFALKTVLVLLFQYLVTPIDGRYVVTTVVSCPCATEKSMYNVVTTLALLFEWIFLIPEGNKDNPKSLNEFEFGPDPTTDCGDRKQNIV